MKYFGHAHLIYAAVFALRSDRSQAGTKDYFLLQNETSSAAQAIRKAHERGLRIVFNPAPMAPAVLDNPLELIDIFILNETEAEGLAGATDPDDIRRAMRKRFPRSATVLTLGSKGAVYFDAQASHHEAARVVKAVDTTAAGDTFIGFFLAELMRSDDPAKAMKQGCRAAAICVTRFGASDSIPLQKDLETFQ